jgi:hypothetical protein
MAGLPPRPAARRALMFFLPGTLLVLVTIYMRPQEILPVLQSVPLLHLFLGLALLGLVLDLRLRIAKPVASPQLPWAILFCVWQVITVVAKSKSGGGIGNIVEIFIPFALFLVIGHGTQTFRALQVIAVTMLAMVLFLSYVAVDQHHAEKGCFALAKGSTREGVHDGRPCAQPIDCQLNGPEPGAEYVCEHVGKLGTNSIGGRVRWRGVLADPNELALAIGVALPFAFALFERRRSASRMALVALSLGLIGTAVVHSQSRGGQLVVAAVMGTYFVRKYGWKGMVLAGLAALPLMVFGGREGKEAEASSDERYECWWAGIEMLRLSPIIGVGKGQFLEYHFLNAHNAYVLSFAENGLIGFLLFSMLIYLGVKVPFTAVQRAAHAPMAPVARAWSLALLASFFGVAVGIFFLSFTYHYVLWTYFGLSAALYSCIRTHDPTFEVKLHLREVVLIVLADLMLIAFLFVYLRGKV